MGIALSLFTLVGCGSSKQVVNTQEQGLRELEIPCEGYGNDTQEYFAGIGVGENVNLQNARVAALKSAQEMIKLKIGGMVKGLRETYNKSVAGNAAQNDVSGIDENDFIQVVDRMLNDAEQTCEKRYQTQTGTYQVHLAVRISKKELAQKVSDKLTEDDKLRTEYDRERFRKFAQEYMEGLKEQGN